MAKSEVGRSKEALRSHRTLPTLVRGDAGGTGLPSALKAGGKLRKIRWAFSHAINE